MKTRITNLQFSDRECGAFCDVDKLNVNHPNRMKFSGTLLYVDEPSTKPPNGSEGHRIYVPKDVAEKRLGTLIGMGLNYSSSLDSHAPRKKVGVIEEAWIEGNAVKVKGIGWQKDFPEIKADLKQGKLGMSMELADVWVRDQDEDVWHLDDFKFTGATVLYKSAAAYNRTSLSASRIHKATLAAAAQALGVNLKRRKDKMLKVDKKTSANQDDKSNQESSADRLVKAIAAAVGPAVKEGIQAAMGPLTETLENLSSSIDEQKTILIEAASNGVDKDEKNKKKKKEVTAATDKEVTAATDDEDDEEDEMLAAADDDIKAKKSKSDDEDDNEDDDDDDEDEEDDMSAELDKLEEHLSNSLADGDEDAEPGKLNKTSKNKGDKKTVSAAARKVSGIAAAAMKTFKTLRASIENQNTQIKKQAKELKKLKTTIEAQEEQIEVYASTQVTRRSIPPEVTYLLEKNGHNMQEIYANAEQGQKLSVRDVDAAFSQMDIPVQERMRMKNILVQGGLMDQGVVEREWNRPN